MLNMLEEVADRLRVIEQEVLKAPRPAVKPAIKRNEDWRPFGR